jgi:5,10-methylene-tetrahydrofolate dehydrogenase/methenyl tetrahydrofolate cyclohydrolase
VAVGPHSDDMSRVVDQLLQLFATFIGLSRLSRSQSVEHKALNLVVVGSSPTVGANVGDLFSNAMSQEQGNIENVNR